MAIKKNFDNKTDKRFIAYFDIMGFTDFMYRNSHEAVHKQMYKVSDIINRLELSQIGVLDETSAASLSLAVVPVMFSDTILLLSKGDTEKDLQSITILSTLFLHEMLANGIPLKGAISYGKFTADIENSIYFGRPLVDAYLLAEEMHFYGVVLHWTAEKAFLKHDGFKKLGSLIKSSLIPTKSGDVRHYYLDLDIMTGSDGIKPVLDALYLSVSGSTRKYVDNTIRVYISE